MMNIRQQLIVTGYSLGWKVLKILPHVVVTKIFEFGADRVSHSGKGMQQLRKNLQRVVGPEHVTRQLVQDSMRSYARYWAEAFRLQNLIQNPAVYTSIERQALGLEHLDTAYAKGKGVVIVLTHSGNWDMAGYFLTQRIGSFVTVAERLEPTRIFDAFVKFRTSLGFKVYPHKDEHGHSPFPKLREALERGEVVCLLGERDLTGKGLEVEFFSETTTMPIGAVKLAQDTGATLLVAHTWFTGTSRNPGWALEVSAPLEVTTVQETLQQQAMIMQRNIAQHPTDWHVLQPLWIADRRARAHK